MRVWVRRHAGTCHLLISEPEQGTVADAIKSLKQGVSRRLLGEAEHFWQKRYYDFNVRNRRQFVEKLRYMHRNPVKRGLCARPEDWEWSSFLHYVTGMEGRVEIESEWVARRREILPHSSQNRLEWGTRRGTGPLLASETVLTHASGEV
ncbi:MAG: transposase [Acidobacteriaceae bacterium]